MSKKGYSKSKGRGNTRTFVQLFHHVLDSPNYLSLSGRAAKLLNLVARDYNGSNNGDLAITYSMMKKRGFTSNDQLQKGVIELKHYGFLILTRQGGLHQPSLYALTFHKIDECNGKHELKPTKTAPNNWKNLQPKKPSFKKRPDRHTDDPRPQGGSIGAKKVVHLDRTAVQSGHF